MIRRTIFALCLIAGALAAAGRPAQAADQAYGRQWGNTYNSQDWNRFYHYPYVYYPQNFWGSEYYRSSDSLYYRYPPEMQIPVYNKQWHNFYPQGSESGVDHCSIYAPGPKYHMGHQFIMDTF